MPFTIDTKKGKRKRDTQTNHALYQPTEPELPDNVVSKIAFFVNDSPTYMSMTGVSKQWRRLLFPFKARMSWVKQHPDLEIMPYVAFKFGRLIVDYTFECQTRITEKYAPFLRGIVYKITKTFIFKSANPPKMTRFIFLVKSNMFSSFGMTQHEFPIKDKGGFPQVEVLGVTVKRPLSDIEIDMIAETFKLNIDGYYGITVTAQFEHTEHRNV